MTRLPRRVFMIRAAAGGAILAVPLVASAAPHVEESDEAAQQLGYRHDSSQVDGAKFPKHQAGQRCADCSFFQGAAGDAWGGCAMFGRKQVSGAGWCSAWMKKP